MNTHDHQCPDSSQAIIVNQINKENVVVRYKNIS
jgi:hypothetical protein